MTNKNNQQPHEINPFNLQQQDELHTPLASQSQTPSATQDATMNSELTKFQEEFKQFYLSFFN